MINKFEVINCAEDSFSNTRTKKIYKVFPRLVYKRKSVIFSEYIFHQERRRMMAYIYTNIVYIFMAIYILLNKNAATIPKCSFFRFFLYMYKKIESILSRTA